MRIESLRKINSWDLRKTSEGLHKLLIDSPCVGLTEKQQKKLLALYDKIERALERNK